MKINKEQKQYTADLYLRISKEDGDKNESDSINNQRELLLDFLKQHPNITLNKVRIDDGYSGVDFKRPAFTEMINDIQSGKVNCVIVKDFSRFGRNYIESGKYIQVMFPKAGIRFIAVNDSYDSANVHDFSSNIIVPFKNIINDAYCADISTKIRSHLDIKRKKGEFVGAFAVYGYLKDNTNKNKLIIDDFAADVIRDIFNWKLEGYSSQSIANKLNATGVLPPMEYKKHLGIRYSTSFKTNSSTQWQSATIKRILQNAIYTGILEQGKRSTPNYKVRKSIKLPKEEWILAENTHEPIITQAVFDKVQILLKQDTRAIKKGEQVTPLAGLLYCGDCGGSMIRKTNTIKGIRYGYFICANHKKDKGFCSTHMISANDCENTVLKAMKAHVSSVIDMESAISSINNIASIKNNVHKLTVRIELQKEELNKYNDFKLSLYESYRDEVISRDDFIAFKSNYDVKIEASKNAIQVLEDEIHGLTHSNSISDIQSQAFALINSFKLHANQSTLERKTVIELIERINIYENKHMEIIFCYADEFSRFMNLIETSLNTGSKEVA